MIAVIFEVVPHPERRGVYLDTAAHLKPLLEKIDGFVSVERFESRTHPGKWLSLSYWRDAEALAAWRRDPDHVKGMAAGKRDVFADYRIVVAAVERDYSFARPAKAG